jgi:hypothetical protein
MPQGKGGSTSICAHPLGARAAQTDQMGRIPRDIDIAPTTLR